MLPIISMSWNHNPDISFMDNAYQIWSTKIRYIGVGAMLIGGIWSLLSVFKFILMGIKKSNKNQNLDEKKDIPTKWVVLGMMLILLILIPLYNQDVGSLSLSIGLSFRS